MRHALIQTLLELAAEDERILVLTGDLGYMVMEPFRDAFPSRFFNVGVAEQNMIAVATGLADAGFIPFTYSIATFASMRPFEFIRNGPVLHRLPVRMVGVGAGFGYGHAGPSHYATEDIAALRTLLGLSIVVPADAPQAVAAIRDTWNSPGPVYYSLCKDAKSQVAGLDGRFAMGRVQVTREGRGVVLATMGSIAAEVTRAADELDRYGINATVAIVSNFYPDPVDDLRVVLSAHDHVVSIEAQTASGGLGALIASVIATHRLGCRLRPLAVFTPHDGTSGSQTDRWKKHGLDCDSIVEAVLDAVKQP